MCSSNSVLLSETQKLPQASMQMYLTDVHRVNHITKTYTGTDATRTSSMCTWTLYSMHADVNSINTKDMNVHEHRPVATWPDSKVCF